jgi:glycyl-tRNA synthetase
VCSSDLVVEGAGDIIYLRPETAQNEFINFQNVQRTMRLRLPFGIGQIGKAFRNEITPGNFTFRTIEFEQMEHQLFCKKDESMNFYKLYKEKAWDFYTNVLGLDKKNLRFKDHTTLAHYASAACDVEYNFPFGFSEIAGTHHRGTFDLDQHTAHCGKPQDYTDPVTGEKFIPTVIESSHGCDRLVLAAICDAYNVEKLDKDDSRTVLKFHPRIAPYKAAVLPLQKKEQGAKAEEIYRALSKHFPVTYDETASIGKRYRRADEAGVPFCITVDFDTEKDGTVTVRDRDSMKQTRLPITDLKEFINVRIL